MHAADVVLGRVQHGVGRHAVLQAAHNSSACTCCWPVLRMKRGRPDGAAASAAAGCTPCCVWLPVVACHYVNKCANTSDHVQSLLMLVPAPRTRCNGVPRVPECCLLPACYPCSRGCLQLHTCRGLGAAAEDAGHATHEGGLAAACNATERRAKVSSHAGDSNPDSDTELCASSPESAARPMTTVLPSLAAWTRQTRALDLACTRQENIDPRLWPSDLHKSYLRCSWLPRPTLII